MISTATVIALACGLAIGTGATWLALRPQTAYPEAGGNDLFRTLFEAAPECVKLQSRDGVVERMNAAGTALLEVNRPGRMIGRSVYDFIAPEYHAAYRDLTEAVFQGRSGTLEFELVTFRGRHRWLETHAVPLRSTADGTVSALLAITRDTTERNWMTRQLEEKNNRLQTIIESEPECVKLHDPDGVILEINPAGRELLDAERDEQLVGRTIYEFVLPDYHTDYQHLTDRVFSGERATMVFEVIGLQGHSHWLETHATPLYGNDGTITALLAITRNIDERKRTEEKLRQQQAELAHVCRLSTLSVLASGLAHEVNQPLNAVSSFAETAATLCNSDHEVQPLLTRIVEQSHRAASIITRLRDFLRKRTPVRAPTAPSVIVDNVLRFAGAEIQYHGVVVRKAITPGAPPVWADRVQIEQVLINLITNALQAVSRESGREPRIDLTVREEGATTAIFEVADNGGGIPPEDREQLFTPFFTTRPDGLGLGLSISRTIIEDHGGRIACDCTADETRFHFTLPAAEK